MANLHIIGPDTEANAARLNAEIPDDARIWLYGPRHVFDLYPSSNIAKAVDNQAKAERMLAEVLNFAEVRRREYDGSSYFPVVLVLHEPDGEFLRQEEVRETLLQIARKGPEFNVRVLLATRPLHDDWGKPDLFERRDHTALDYEALADKELGLAEDEDRINAAQLHATYAQVYLTKALLQELRNSRS